MKITRQLCESLVACFIYEVTKHSQVRRVNTVRGAQDLERGLTIKDLPNAKVVRSNERSAGHDPNERIRDAEPGDAISKEDEIAITRGAAEIGFESPARYHSLQGKLAIGDPRLSAEGEIPIGIASKSSIEGTTAGNLSKASSYDAGRSEAQAKLIRQRQFLKDLAAKAEKK